MIENVEIDKFCNTMEIKEIKEIPIVGYLEKKGYTPNKIRGDAYYYTAFWRGGDNPTNVRVDIKQNLWYDYAEGVGGSIIELAMRVENCDKAEALKTLSNGFSDFAGTHTPPTQKEAVIRDKSIGISRITSLTCYPVNRAITGYLQERGINLVSAIFYDCSAVYYKVYPDLEKTYFAVGFRNRSGWVLRNKYFKGCTAQDISVIPFAPGSTKYIVFEGFIDLLSYATLYGCPQMNVIVLNSIVNVKKAYEYFDQAERIYLLLDNDSKGKEITANILAIYGDKAVDKSYHYAPYKDLNEFLMKGGKNGK